MPVSTLGAGSLPHPESKKASGPDGRGREGSENRNVGLGSGRKRGALSTGGGGRRGHWLHSRLPPLGPGKQEAVSHLGEGRAQPRESASPSGSPVPWQQGFAYVTGAASPQPHLYSGDKSASAVICSED